MPDTFFFYASAFLAVTLVGLSKGGLGGAMALLGVPILALSVPPVQAAAILLPVLVAMDLVSLWSWRHSSDARTLKVMLPGGLIGIAIGWLTASMVRPDAVRLLVGVIALVFALRYAWSARPGAAAAPPPAPHRPLKGTFWGAVSGFTSFLSHAGGPPYQVYTLPLRQDPKVYTGASVRFFAIVNAVKLVPYFFLGELGVDNLKVSALLIPVAMLATLAGAHIVRRLRPAVFYPMMYTMVFLAALKLMWDGTSGLLGG